MAAVLVDIGVNLAHDSFDPDRDAVIARAVERGVGQMIVTGSDGPSSKAALTLARTRPGTLFATAGVHPHHAAQLDAPLLGEIEALARQPEVVAVGECGLDYYRNYAPADVQRAAFHRQLELAARVGKPVFLHQREAHADFLGILKEHRGALSAGVAHCFTGTRAQLEAYLELDLAIGVTGWICDERRGTHLIELMRAVPEHRLLVETDAPYLLPRDIRPRPASRRNEPAHLPHVAAAVAKARSEPFESLAASTTAAARALFGLGNAPPHLAAN